MDDPELSAVRLDQPDHEEVVALRMEDVLVEVRAPIPPIEMTLVHKRKRDEVPGGRDEEIDGLRRPVREVDSIATQPLEAGLRCDRSVLHEVGQERIDDGVRLEEPVVRLRKSEVLVTSHE